MTFDLKNFFDYKPLFNIKQIDDFFEEHVKKEVINNLGEKAGEKIQKAYDFAKERHGEEKRLSGEPYLVHPVYVSKYLLMIKPGITELQGALLHDIIEDTDTTSEEVVNEFGPELAFLCLGLEKVSKVKYKGEDRQVETLKKTFLAMGRDIRVIFIKLADRIHNIQTLKYHPKKEKQQRIAMETIKIYAPLSKRLGIEIFQHYLENGAFAILNPEEFNKIFEYLKKYYFQLDFNSIKLKLENLLESENIEYLSIKGRLKTPYRIYLKFEKYNSYDIKDIKDVLAFRVILKDISQCYKTLGVVHSEYTPIINKIKDYISLPKQNGYQSLHTTVLGLYKTAVEIQIRTKSMDDFAGYGVAAHFIYKEKGSSYKINKKQIEWINKLRNLANDYQENIKENKGFFNVLDIDFLRSSVFVYTPKGQIIELPKGSTVLDFAFRIHTNIGTKFNSALVNGKIVPINYQLRNGDIVEIKTFKNKYVIKESWLDYVISPASKNKIKSFLNKQTRTNKIERAEDILNKELENYNLPLLGSKDDKIKKDFNDKQLNSVLLQIYNKQISVFKVLKNVYNLKKVKPEPKIKDNKKNKNNDIIIENSSIFKYFLCPECNPEQHDRIIGKITSDGVKIHKIKCKALKSVNFEKLVEAHWRNQVKEDYNILLHFDLSEKILNVVYILNLIQSFDVKVDNINTFKDNKNNDFMDVKISISLPTTLHLINQKLKKECKHLYNSYKISFI